MKIRFLLVKSTSEDTKLTLLNGHPLLPECFGAHFSHSLWPSILHSEDSNMNLGKIVLNSSLSIWLNFPEKPCGPRVFFVENFFFFILWLHPWHMEVHGPGVESKLQLKACTKPFNPLCRARDQTCTSSSNRAAAIGFLTTPPCQKLWKFFFFNKLYSQFEK